VAALSAADEFGFSRPSFATPQDASQPGTPLAAVEASMPGENWWQHPSFALGVLVLVTATALGHSTRPIVGAKGSASVGPAKGSVEGSI